MQFIMKCVLTYCCKNVHIVLASVKPVELCHFFSMVVVLLLLLIEHKLHYVRQCLLIEARSKKYVTNKTTKPDGPNLLK